MAISIDTVYQRVLALANKEQRGYITPQELNLFANKSQMEIFKSFTLIYLLVSSSVLISALASVLISALASVSISA